MGHGRYSIIKAFSRRLSISKRNSHLDSLAAFPSFAQKLAAAVAMARAVAIHKHGTKTFKPILTVESSEK